MMQELIERLQQMAEGAVNCIHTAIPGSIVSFDPSTCLATVSPKMKYTKPDGSKIDYPNVAGVPVYFPQGANQKASIAYPVKPGDGCLLFAAEQSLDFWMYGRETTADLRYDLTNSVALVGLFVRPGPGVQKACDENAVVVMAESVVLTVKPERVEIDGDLKVNGRIDATDRIKSDADVLAVSVSLKNHTHDCPHGGSTSVPN